MNRNPFFDSEKFERIVDFSRHSHPFYQARLATQGRVPLLTRDEVRRGNRELLNNHPIQAKTSGATGVPVQVAYSPQRVALERQSLRRYANWMGGQAQPFEIIYGATEPYQFDIHTPLGDMVSRLVSAVLDEGFTSVVTYPTQAEWIARELKRRNLLLPGVERVGLVGEHVDRRLPSILQEVFPQSRVWSHYASMEVGIIAVPFHGKWGEWLPVTEKLGLEILDEHDEPCLPGQLGRIIVTDYGNTYMPWIRYEIGDLGCWQISRFDRKTPVLTGIFGKERGSLKLKDGSRMPFIALSEKLRDLPGMVQYRVIQEAVDRFTVKVVGDGVREASICQTMAAAFPYPVTIVVESGQDPLPREPGGKFLIAQGLP